MNRPVRLTVTHFEDRLVPAGFGNTWVDPNLTASFAPDGTLVSGVPSTLSRTLGSRMTSAEWQGTIKAAFQEWIAPANLNVAFVGDDGRAFGSPGPIQGSPAVGDIRIAARPLSDNVMAISNPFDLISPWAGEIVLNSNKVFDNDGSAGAVDLRTVLLQEVGHVLGVGNCDDPCSVMYEYGGSPCFASEDAAAVQALYGPREPDQFDARHTNTTLMNSSGLTYIQKASDLAGTDGTQGSVPYVAAGDITTGDDLDTYYVTPPKTQTNPAVVVETAGLSSVRLKVSVYYRVASYGANTGQLLVTTSTPDAKGNYVLPFLPTQGWYTYYVRVQAAANAGPFNVGSYRLAMGDNLSAIPGSQYSTKIATSNGTVTESSDWDGGRPANDTIAAATQLGDSRVSNYQRWDYNGTATLDAAADVDVYQVRTTAQSGSVLVVSVDTALGGVEPQVSVFDSRGRALAAETLLRNGSATIVQVQGVKQSATYYVSVKATNPWKWAGREFYNLGIDFRATPIQLDTFATGTLTQAQSQAARTLEVTRSQMFRFQLTATSSTDTGPTTARLTIFNSAGKAVFTLVSRNGQAVVGDILLAPGTYKVVIVGATIDGSSLKGLQIDARFMPLTDPIGPALTDDYGADSTARTDGTTDTGYVLATPVAIGTGFLSSSDPYSSPWW